MRGLEHLPPVSTPFRRFLSRLTCWAPAQRRSLGAKITRKLPAHRCFAVFTEQNWAEARRRPQGILSYFQGLERSISPILPAKTDRGSSPLTLSISFSDFFLVVNDISFSSVQPTIALVHCLGQKGRRPHEGKRNIIWLVSQPKKELPRLSLGTAPFRFCQNTVCVFA